MNLNQFLLIIRARKWLIISTFLATLVIILGVSFVLPKNYTATATLVINAKGLDPITGMTLPYQLTPEYLSTQEAIISSPGVAVRVVDALGLQKIPSLQKQFAEGGGQGDIRYYIAKLLLNKLTVKPELNTNLVDVSYEAPNPEFAAIIANAFAKSYIQTNLDLKTQPAQQTEAWYDQQVAQLRNNLQKAQDKLSKYQQQNGLVLSDERLDLETSRLADLSGQLVSAQAASFDATSKQKERTQLPDVINNPVVQALTPQLVELDAKLAELSKKIGPNNPTYQSTLAQRNIVKKQLDDAYHTAEQSITATAQASRSRVAKLRTALATQKTKVLEIKKERDQAALLQQDVSNAKLAYDNAMQRMSQNSLEAKSVQTDVAILNGAIPPTEPSSPKILLNTIAAIFLGGLLGMGAAFGLEILNRRVRSPEDIQEFLGLPLLNASPGKPFALPNSRPKFFLPFRRQSA